MRVENLILALSLALVLFPTGAGNVRVPRESRIGDGGPAVLASLNGPCGIAVDAFGHLFIADELHFRVRRVDLKTGTITTVAGNGSPGTSGDGGLATLASLEYPADVATDMQGNLFIADFIAGRIRRVDAQTGIISTVAGNGDRECYSVTPPLGGALATASCLEAPEGIAVDDAGNLFITDRRHRVYRLDATTGTLAIFAGGGRLDLGDGGPATACALTFPMGLCFDRDRNMYIADSENCRIRRVDGKTNVITTIAGTDEGEAPTTPGPARDVHLSYPSSVVADGVGNVYFDEGSRGRIWRIDAKTQTVVRYAGSARRGFRGDGGQALKARLYNPSGLAIDRQGNLYVADFVTNRVRRIDAVTGVITTVAGNGLPHRVDVLLPIQS